MAKVPKNHELFTASVRYRTLLVAAAILYPVWALVPFMLGSSVEVALGGRLVIACLCLGIVIASFVSDAVQRHFEKIVFFAALIIMGHYSTLAHAANLSASSAIGYIICLVGIATAFETTRYLVGFLSVTVIFSLFIGHDGGSVPKTLFVDASLISAAVTYITFRDKLRLLSTLKANNRDLAASRLLLHQALEHMPHGIYVKDIAADGAFVIWNRRMEALTGVPKERALGLSDREIYPKDEADRQARVDRFVIQERTLLDVPEELIRAASGHFPAHTVRVPIISEQGELSLLLGVIEDISELKQREELIRSQQVKLLHTSKLSTLGEMSGGVAHEINNPLTVIKGFALRLESLVTAAGPLDQAEVKRCVAKITQMTGRIAAIVRGLKTFAREASQDPYAPAVLASIIADTLELCRQRFVHHGVSLKVEAVSPQIMLECRAVQVSQVLLNLLSNAFDAVQTLDERWVQVQFQISEDQIQISVIDSGKGISPQIAAKMLHPFFTTKPVGHGTGLGLSISRGIVESHSGKLYYDSSHPNTRFVVELPRRQKGQVAAA